MPRYIDADALISKIFPIGMIDDGCYTINAKAVKTAIDNAPIANVVEVVHGEWEKDPDMVRMNGHIYDYRCSRCHSMAVEGCYNNNDRFTNFCPNCGAKMDGERKDNG